MKNKILTISIILILLSFIFINSCFATGFEDYPTVPILNKINGVDVSNFNHHILIYHGSDAIILKVVYFSKEYLDPTFYIWNDDSFIISIEGDGKPPVFYYQNYLFDTTSNSWNIALNGSCNNFQKFGLSGYTFYASTVDIYNSDRATLFFQQTPVPQDLTLAMVLEMNSPMEIFKKQMKNVVVSLVAFLVGLVAFLKAWAWLKTQLHKA